MTAEQLEALIEKLKDELEDADDRVADAEAELYEKERDRNNLQDQLVQAELELEESKK